MTTVFACVCGKELRAPAEFAGRTTKCPGCGQPVTIPPPAPPPALEVIPVEPPPLPEPGVPAPLDSFPGTVASPQRSRLAAASLWAGILAVALILGSYPLSALLETPWVSGGAALLALLLGFTGAILGILALPAISRSQGRLTGTGQAITGLVLGALTGMCCLGFGMTVGASKARFAANRISAINNLRNIGIALHIYHQDNGRFPRANENGLSWRVHLLPHLEQEALYAQFRLNEPWNSPHNIQLVERMPKVFNDPRFSPGLDGRTYYRALTGPGTMFGLQRPLTLNEITSLDGTAFTWMVVEARDSVPWTKPDELVIAPDRPLPLLGAQGYDEFLALFVDAHVERIKQRHGEQVFRAYISVNGREKLP